jgi:hypothetical protein
LLLPLVQKRQSLPLEWVCFVDRPPAATFRLVWCHGWLLEI